MLHFGFIKPMDFLNVIDDIERISKQNQILSLHLGIRVHKPDDLKESF